MQRIIKSMEEKYLLSSPEMVEKVFTEYENPKEGKLVRRLVEEIRKTTETVDLNQATSLGLRLLRVSAYRIRIV